MTIVCSKLKMLQYIAHLHQTTMYTHPRLIPCQTLHKPFQPSPSSPFPIASFAQAQPAELTYSTSTGQSLVSLFESNSTTPYLPPTVDPILNLFPIFQTHGHLANSREAINGLKLLVEGNDGPLMRQAVATQYIL